MTILQTKCYPIPIVIENINKASAHITYYAHITPSYPMTFIQCWSSVEYVGPADDVVQN